MKQKLIFIFCAIIPLIACKKGPGEPSAHLNTLSAKINGLSHVADKENVLVLSSFSPVPGTRAVNVYGKAYNGHEVYLRMENYDGTIKTFTDDSTNPGAIGGFSRTQGLYNTSYSTNGEIRLTSIDAQKYESGVVANGIFHFDTDTTAGFYSVTEGNFSIFISHRDY